MDAHPAIIASVTTRKSGAPRDGRLEEEWILIIGDSVDTPAKVYPRKIGGVTRGPT